VWQYSQGKWSSFPSLPPITGALASALWASSATDVWVGTKTPASTGALYRWSGGAWQQQTQPVDGGTGLGPDGWCALGGSGPSDVWAADGSRMIRFDGTAWTYEGQVGPLGNSQPIGCATFSFAANDLWLGGTELWHWRGAHDYWDEYKTPTVTVRGIWGSHPWDVWAVGDNGTVWHWH
jgi:hypothetical protein